MQDGLNFTCSIEFKNYNGNVGKFTTKLCAGFHMHKSFAVWEFKARQIRSCKGETYFVSVKGEILGKKMFSNELVNELVGELRIEPVPYFGKERSQGFQLCSCFAFAATLKNWKCWWVTAYDIVDMGRGACMTIYVNLRRVRSAM